MTDIVFDYIPTPRQEVAHRTFADEILWGGSAGAGKSRWLRAEFIAYALRVPGSAQVLFRRYYPDLERGGGMIPGFKIEMPEGVATYNEVKHRWTFINGSTIDLAALGRIQDVYKFQGSEYARIAFDELTQFDEFTYTYMQSRLRVSGKVKTRMAQLGIRPSMLATSNPGGIGHGWVKARFIDPAPPDTIWKPAPTLEDPKPGTRIFMPARVTDNTHVNDEYIDKLNALPEAQRRALRDGDWDVYSGQMFKAFRRSVHVIDPEEFSLRDVIDAPKAVAVDYGMSAPFCALWGALLPNGLVYVYREAYRAELTPEQQADMILDLEVEHERRQEWPIPVVLDSACWARSPGQLRKQPQVVVDDNKDTPPEGSIAWAYYERFGRDLRKSIKDRLSSVALVQDRLEVRPDGFPRLLISSQCRNLIRTLPALPRDDRDPEQVDCFVAGTMIRVPGGEVPVETLQEGDWVETPMGPQRVLKAGVEGAVRVARVDLSNGASLVGTADHEVVTERGLVALQDLNITDSLISWLTPGTRLSTAATLTEGKQGRPTTPRLHGPVSVTGEAAFTATFLSTTEASFPTAGTSITSTTTPRTTTQATSKPFPRVSTPSITTVTEPTTWQQLDALGSRRPKLLTSSEQQPARCAPTLLREMNRARIVEAYSELGLESTSTAPSSALTKHVGSATFEIAQSVATSSADNSTGETLPRLVPTSVDGSYGVEDVYALTVDGCALYYANNVLVTNTKAEDHAYDALSYLLQEFAHRYPEAVTTAERQRRNRREGASPFGGVASLTGGIAGPQTVGDW